MPRVQHVHHERDAHGAAGRSDAARPITGQRGAEVLVRHAREFSDGRVAPSRIPVAGQVCEIDRPAAGTARPAVYPDPIQIRQAGLAWRRARPRERCPRQRVDERRLSDIRPTDERDVRDSIFRNRVAADRTDDEPRVDDFQCDTAVESAATGLSTAGGVKIHSRPQYHGAYVAIWTMLPKSQSSRYSSDG